MLILTIRSDRPDAEIGLYDDDTQLAYQTWYAHRELSVTLHQKITDMLASQHKTLEDLEGVVCFAGPGSFTGLRIGLTIGNALVYGLGDLPIVAITGEEDWIQKGISRLLAGERDPLALPEYGAPVHITQQKK